MQRLPARAISTLARVSQRGRPRLSSVLAGLSALAVVVSATAQSSAQTLDLGTGQYAVYENGGSLNLNNSSITGNVEFSTATEKETLTSSSISGSQSTNVSPVVTTLPAANATTNLGVVSLTTSRSRRRA
jgi:hypothetical protein